jgi:hypothetical protein
MPTDLHHLLDRRRGLIFDPHLSTRALAPLSRKPRSLWPWAMGVALGAVLVGIAIHRLRAPDTRRRRLALMESDASDPYKRWVQSVFLIVSGDCDYAHLDRGEGRSLLRDWWEIHGPRTHVETMRTLADAGRPDNAWDLVRFVVLARLGVAADYMSDEESWELIRPIAHRLQHAYANWRPMAQAYLAARRQWRGLPLDGSEDDEEMEVIVANIARLHDSRWQSLPFRTDLELDHGRG